MAPTHPQNFYDLGVRTPLVRALEARGIVEPFPIQAESLPDSLAGRDVLGKGRTGSGKTVAFALPVIERVLEADGRARPHHPRAIIMVPTRELAVQVHETVEALAQAVSLRSMTVFGGVRYTGQLKRLERGVDIVVATPGRLEDLIAQEELFLDDVRVVVLDEADMMADMGFLPPVTRVLDAVPAGQRMLFSATLDEDVQKVVDTFLSDPLVHAVEGDDDLVDATHYLFLVRQDNKYQVLKDLVSGGGRTLAFARTKFGAERIARELNEAGIPAVELHGNLHQGARQRNLAKFAEGKVSVLVATDIAARGIHVDDIGLVVHVDPPAEPKAFLHRSGRTARAGATGNVVTLALRNQNKPVRQLMAQAGIKPEQHVVAPGDEIIAAVRAPRVIEDDRRPSMFEPDPEDVAGESEERWASIETERPTRDRSPRNDRRNDRGQARPSNGHDGHGQGRPGDRSSGRDGGQLNDGRPARGRRSSEEWAARDDRRPAPRDERGFGRDDDRRDRPSQPNRDRDAWRTDRRSAAGGGAGRGRGYEDRRSASKPDRRDAPMGHYGRTGWDVEPWESDEAFEADQRRRGYGADRRADRAHSSRTERGEGRPQRDASRSGSQRPSRGASYGRDDRAGGSDRGDRRTWSDRDNPPRADARRGGYERDGRRGDDRQGRSRDGRRDERPAGFRGDGRDDRRGTGPRRDDRRQEGRPGDRQWDDRRRDGGPDDGRVRRDDRGPRRLDDEGRSVKASKAKGRWSDDDRRKAAQAHERGFGYAKGGPSKGKKGGSASKGAQASRKDKGKPKRFRRD